MRKVSRGQSLDISADDWNSIADTVNGSPFGAHGRDVPAGAFSNSALGSLWLWIKNTSGSDRSRWDCMSLSTPLFTIGNDGHEDLIMTAVTATSNDVPVILLEPIADGLFGRAVIDGFCLAHLATAPSSGLTYAVPNGTGHNLLPSNYGAIRLLATGSTSDPTLRPVLLGSGALGGGEFYLTPVGGIPGRTGSGSPWTPGVATCTLCEFYDDGGTIKIRTTATTDSVYNSAGPVGASKLIQVKTIRGRKVVDVDPCD